MAIDNSRVRARAELEELGMSAASTRLTVRTVVHCIALLLLAIGVIATAPVAAAHGRHEVRAGNDVFCEELTAPDFGQVVNVPQAKIVLGHYERATKDAPKAVRRSLKRVSAFLRRIVSGEVEVSELGHPGAKLDRDFVKIFDRVEEICPRP